MSVGRGLSHPSLLQTFFRRIEQRDELGLQERGALADLFHHERTIAAGEEIVSEGERPGKCTLLLAGFAARAKLMEDGGRQITAFHVPGDFVDLHSFLIKELDHAVVAITDITITEVVHSDIEKITERFPHLTRLLWLLTLLDSAVHREWLVGLGRLSATARAAHLFREMGIRLEAVELGTASEYEFPITQSDLADAMGLSAVHVNRVVQELRSRGLLVWQGSRVNLPDLAGIDDLAEFDSRYLHLTREPR
jgi:CRP-like cAMP-binding protein